MPGTQQKLDEFYLLLVWPLRVGHSALWNLGFGILYNAV